MRTGETNESEEWPDGNARRRRRSCAASTPVRFHLEIYLQHRSQSNWHSILEPGLVLGVRRDGIVSPDAVASGVADHEMVFLQGRLDDARAVSGVDDDAWHDHGLHGVDHGAAVRVWQLLLAYSNRRRRHGVPGVEHAVVLDDVRVVARHDCRIFCCRWRADWRVDVLSAVERAGRNGRTGAGSRRDALDCWLGDLLRRFVDGRAKFHYDADRPPCERDDAGAPAADVLDMVCD